jgi:hypothetical protein
MGGNEGATASLLVRRSRQAEGAVSSDAGGLPRLRGSGAVSAAAHPHVIVSIKIAIICFTACIST